MKKIDSKNDQNRFNEIIRDHQEHEELYSFCKRGTLTIDEVDYSEGVVRFSISNNLEGEKDFESREAMKYLDDPIPDNPSILDGFEVTHEDETIRFFPLQLFAEPLEKHKQRCREFHHELKQNALQVAREAENFVKYISDVWDIDKLEEGIANGLGDAQQGIDDAYGASDTSQYC